MWTTVQPQVHTGLEFLTFFFFLFADGKTAWSSSVQNLQNNYLLRPRLETRYKFTATLAASLTFR